MNSFRATLIHQYLMDVGRERDFTLDDLTAHVLDANEQFSSRTTETFLQCYHNTTRCFNRMKPKLKSEGFTVVVVGQLPPKGRGSARRVMRVIPYDEES